MRQLPVIGFDRPADFVEQLLGHRTGGVAQVVEGGWGGELGDPRQIAVLHVPGGIQAAAGEDGVLAAGGEHIPEPHLQVEAVQPLQQAVFHVVGQIPQAIPVDLARRPRRQLHELFPDVPVPGGAVPPLQRLQYGGVVLLPQFPQVGRPGPPHRAGIGHVKDVLQIGPAPPVLVNEGDTLGTGLHPAPHGFIPQLHAGAGGGVRALGVDQELVVKRVFV